MSSHTVGIDLGTTRSAVAYVAGDSPKIIKIDGDSVVRSVVHVTESGEAVVGTDADDHLVMNPDRTVEEVKKKMGEDVEIELGSETYSPEQISALIVEYIVKRAEERVGEEIEDVVITVPAYFGERQRTATATTGELAGVNVTRLLPEPSAACLAYGFKEGMLGDASEELVFVYDLGGGTFDATLVEVDYEVNLVETIHTDGDNELGGADWTDAIVEWMADIIMEETGVDIHTQPEQLARLRGEARSAKHSLSRQEEIDITIPFIIPEENYSFDESISRTEFDEMTGGLLDRTAKIMDELFDRSEYTPADVDKTLLVGGSTRMKQVEELVTEYFGSEPSKEINPDEAVALGAAVQAEIISDDGSSAETLLPGSSEDLLLIDVVPKSLGIRLHDGSIDHIIESDTQIPTMERKESYGTAEKNQRNVRIQVYEGEGTHVDDDDTELLGEAHLEDIEPREPGGETLACEFEITADGTLRVQGEDLLSGKDVETTIESAIHRSDAEISDLKDGLPPIS